METILSGLLSLKYEPVAILWSNQKPEHAIEFKPGKWGCVMWWFVSSAKGKTAVFSRETYGCWGGGIGLGFGNCYKDFPGGEDCFCRFLSTGNKGHPIGEGVAEQIKNFVTPEFMQDFLHGEGYLSSPEQVQNFIQSLPIIDIPYEYVIFKPLSQINTDIEQPKTVVFLVEPHQLSALIILANFRSRTMNNVIVPYSAGCQTIGIWAYANDDDNDPKAIIGLTDISARLNVKKQIGDNYLTITFPWKLFLQIEEDAPNSFLVKETWSHLTKGKGIGEGES
ncbi:MAG TPA: DUF169 domain-containing protein [Candidatus Hydrogenedens sp.]|nr:DUF169 domain-containing protein [Candidatus Hydrogenedens sp.]